MLRAFLVSAAIIALFGIGVPLVRGLGFLNPLLLSAYLLLGVIIVAPVAASAFSGNQPVAGPEALRKVGLAAGFAWGLSLAVVAAGLITVNLASRYPRALVPNARFLTAAILCGAVATVFAALFSALVARRYSAEAARNAVRLIFLGLVIFAVALSRFGGPEWMRNVFRWSTTSHLRTLLTAAAAVLAILDVVLAMALGRVLSRAAPAK